MSIDKHIKILNIIKKDENAPPEEESDEEDIPATPVDRGRTKTITGVFNWSNHCLNSIMLTEERKKRAINTWPSVYISSQGIAEYINPEGTAILSLIVIPAEIMTQFSGRNKKLSIFCLNGHQEIWLKYYTWDGGNGMEEYVQLMRGGLLDFSADGLVLAIFWRVKNKNSKRGECAGCFFHVHNSPNYYPKWDGTPEQKAVAEFRDTEFELLRQTDWNSNNMRWKKSKGGKSKKSKKGKSRTKSKSKKSKKEKKQKSI